MAVNGDVSERPSPAKVRGVFASGRRGLSGCLVGSVREAGCYICVRICVTRIIASLKTLKTILESAYFSPFGG